MRFNLLRLKRCEYKLQHPLLLWKAPPRLRLSLCRGTGLQRPSCASPNGGPGIATPGTPSQAPPTHAGVPLLLQHLTRQAVCLPLSPNKAQSSTPRGRGPRLLHGGCASGTQRSTWSSVDPQSELHERREQTQKQSSPWAGPYCENLTRTTYLILTTALGATYYYYPHFIDEHTEDQRGWETCPRSPSRWLELGGDPRHLPPWGSSEPFLSTASR